MPEMDGFTATKLIRARAGLQDLPIIAMTAHALVEERQRCLEAGMNDHVSKPIDPDALFATLIRWVKPAKGQIVHTGSRPAERTEGTILPEIPGVDIAAGLKRVAGNRRLYRDLLVQFVEKQCDAASQISAAIESGNPEVAERIAHTVKGVAGNIGIESVFTAADKIGASNSRAKLWNRVIGCGVCSLASRRDSTIRRALNERLTSRPAKGRSTATFDSQAISAALARLRVLLEASDGGAIDALIAVEDALAGAIDQERMNEQMNALCKAVNDFDFEAALSKLDKITEQYGAAGSAAMPNVPGKKTVLVVDDAPANIQIVNAILKDDYNIRVATSGAKALDLIKLKPFPDLVLLDVLMPDMDGYEVCGIMKATPEAKDIPVIFLTGKTEADDRDERLRNGRCRLHP